MKYKIICLLTILFCFSMAATPNRCTSNGLQCAGKQKVCGSVPRAGGTPQRVALMIDETELLPIHQFFNNF